MVLLPHETTSSTSAVHHPRIACDMSAYPRGFAEQKACQTPAVRRRVRNPDVSAPFVPRPVGVSGVGLVCLAAHSVPPRSARPIHRRRKRNADRATGAAAVCRFGSSGALGVAVARFTEGAPGAYHARNAMGISEVVCLRTKPGPRPCPRPAARPDRAGSRTIRARAV
jgi:hypothetical protein